MSASSVFAPWRRRSRRRRVGRDPIPCTIVNQGRAPDPPLPPGLKIVRRMVDGILVIAAIGEVDLDTAPALGTALNACIDETGDKPCILDLTAVTFLNSPGLTMLLGATDRAEALHEPLRIVVDANRPVIRPIQVTGLDNELALYHTVDEAVRADKPSA
jgi:anti-sigma B factor antagonist